MSVYLSFDVLPHYVYSNRRQFLPDEHHLERVFHEDILILMRKGVLRFSEDGVPYELHPGEYYIQRKGLTQTAPLKSDSPNYFFIHFHGTFSEHGTLPLRGTFKPDVIQPLIDAFNALGNDSSNLEYSKLFYSVLSHLARQQSEENPAEKIKLFILQNYKTSVTLESLSKQFFLSVNQIINIFRAAYGKTPHRYLMDYRLDKASDLLTSTLRPVNDIARQVGFDDYSVFYRAFQTKYDVSPSEYREIKQAKFFIPPEDATAHVKEEE